MPDVRLPRLSPDAYRRVTAVALVALVVIVVTGASVRLTGSGLGCSDWPACEEDRLVADMGDVHGMIEQLNRYFTGVVSLAVMAAVLGSLVRTPRRGDLTVLSLGLVAGVIAQIVWGGLTVLNDLAPQFVMGHFLISALLVWDAVVLHERAAHGPPLGEGRRGSLVVTKVRPVVPRQVLALGRVAVALAAVTIVAGTVVTNTGPHAGDEEAVRFGFQIIDVVRIHAVSALALLAVSVAELVLAYRAGAPERVRRRGGQLVGAIAVQVLIGYVQYFTGVPALLVGLHVLGSVLVWIAVLRLHLVLVARTGDTEGVDEAPLVVA